MALYQQIFCDFVRGDITLFYKKMYPELLLYVSRILGNDFAFLAEDCVQDAVLKTYRKRDSFPTALQWKVYLYTCLRNQAITVLRKGQAHTNYLNTDEAHITETNSLMLDIIEQETLTLLYKAIDALPEKYRQLVEMSFAEGLKNAEVAQRLNISEITVKKRKARLIHLLRANLSGKIDSNTLLILLSLWQMEG